MSLQRISNWENGQTLPARQGCSNLESCHSEPYPIYVSACWRLIRHWFLQKYGYSNSRNPVIARKHWLLNQVSFRSASCILPEVFDFQSYRIKNYFEKDMNYR